MCRTKLNTVRLWSDFRATADSDGVLASDLIGEGHGKQFSMRIQLFRGCPTSVKAYATMPIGITGSKSLLD